VSTSSEPSRPLPRFSFFRLAVSGEAGLLLLAWALGRWLDISPSPGPILAGLVWGLAGTFPLVLALRWMLTTANAALRRLTTLVEQELGPFLGSLSLLELGALAAVAGFSEEALFRGVLLPALSRELSMIGGLVASSVLFGLVHFASRTYAVVAGLMGLYLGILFLLSGGLVAPIVSHALYDFAALVVVARRVRDRQS
jgi:membrane protease YdiL (CAAX protease family)